MKQKYKYYLSAQFAENSNTVEYKHRKIEDKGEMNDVIGDEFSLLLADNYYIGSRVNKIKGKILTLLDASLSEGTLWEKRKKQALKDMVHIIISEEFSHIDRVLGHRD